MDLSLAKPYETKLLVNTLEALGYKISQRPLELNIVGLRANSAQANKFDDNIHVFWYDNNGKPEHHKYQATTDPGTYWLQNPLIEKGTAILAQGQYEAAYSIGLHRGQYKALVQVRPVKVIRDYDRNAVLDFYNGKVEIGMFGINIHRALENGSAKFIDKSSAGCQVFCNSKDFDQFMQFCETHRQLYGNSFNYTLIDQRAVSRTKKRELVYTVLGAAAGIGAALVTYQLTKPRFSSNL